MITYVNTVLVSNLATASIVSAEPTVADAGKFVIVKCGLPYVPNQYISSAAQLEDVEAIKVGVVTSKTTTQINPNTGVATTKPVIKWSNIINAKDVKSVFGMDYEDDTEDTITIDFSNLSENVLNTFAEGGKRIIVRLTFKDTPTRYRKWTESYEYVTQAGDTKATIASNIANLINKEWKRARVIANGATANKVILTAMQYDDDNSVDTINVANKVRFNANVYYTDPAAEGWESKNKLYPTGVTINKIPGKTYVASAKLVRDREAQAMGYQGILNRGEGTWPIIKPEMETDLNAHYNCIILEFENMYRAADDIFRKTKQTLEIYATGSILSLNDILWVFAGHKL